MWSEALRARDWKDRKIRDLVSTKATKRKERLDQPKIQDFNDTVNDLVTDPLIGLVLPMEIDNMMFDKIV